MLIAAGIWITETNTNITITQYSIHNPKIPAAFHGFKIAQVSDFHNQQWGDKLIGLMEGEKPDIIVVTGDLVDSSHTDFGIAMDFINSALKIAPVYYVPGNHEARLNRYDTLKKQLMDSGVHVLENQREWIVKKEAKINLVGIEDPDFFERSSFDDMQKSVSTTLQSLLDTNSYNIVLCHRPELFTEYVNAQANLVLTGHAHGGQIRIPFIGGLIAPDQGFFPKFTEGIHSQGATNMIISRGLGNSILPIRINNTPELVVISLQSYT